MCRTLLHSSPQNNSMELHIHIHLHDEGDSVVLKELKKLSSLITKNQNTVMADLKTITDAVEKETTVDASIITLLTQISDELKAAGTDQTALDALAQKINDNADAIAAAVTANTPAAPVV